MPNFLFASAENDAIPYCKAGGMGDVVRDVPRHIAQRGDTVHVITPAYSRLHIAGNFMTDLYFSLRGMEYVAQLYEVQPKKHYKNIKHYVIHHPEIEAGNIAHIYHTDQVEPFYTDAIKYFIFCTALAEAIKRDAFKQLDVVHLHDWHTSTLLFLREFCVDYQELKSIRFVYTIHNLAIQGIRPLENNYSSVRNWFPHVGYDYNRVKDDRYPDCINLMAIGIRFADSVHTVSPSYKKDVLLPSRPPEFIGGEGLERDLQQADLEGRFFGILNGSNYKNINIARKSQLFYNIINTIFPWLQQESKKYKADFLAHTGEKIVPLLKNPPAFICSSVARLTEQKFYFFKRSPEAFVAILEKLKPVNGIFILLGTGAPEYEELFRGLSHQHKNFLFINGQSEKVIDSIYLETDLYFMPSMFEPCGISQMLAMRNGNPCYVHHTGGLIDTVEHMVTGFAFDGDTYDEKIENFVTGFQEILDLHTHDYTKWKQIKANAKKMRFTWKDSVDKYYKLLYKL